MAPSDYIIFGWHCDKQTKQGEITIYLQILLVSETKILQLYKNMSNNFFFNKIRTFFGLGQEPPKNEFRNPIWGSDEDDDDDSELYTKHQDIQKYQEPIKHLDVADAVAEFYKLFGRVFANIDVMFPDQPLGNNFESSGSVPDQEPRLPSASEWEDSERKNIRDYYLKPGYHSVREDHPKKDTDLDGMISSDDLSKLWKQSDNVEDAVTQFTSDVVSSGSFCQTVITTSRMKPDGTVETRRIVKRGDAVLEDITTDTFPNLLTSYSSEPDTVQIAGIISSNLSSIMSLFKHFKNNTQ